MRLPRIETCSSSVNFLRPVNQNGCRYPQTASKLTNMYDAFINRLDGFKPVTLMGRNKETNTFVLLRDQEGIKGNIGRKFVNWVKTREKDYATQKSIFGYTGSNTRIYHDKATQMPIFKMHDNKNFWTRTIFKEGNVQMIEKLDKKKDYKDAYSVYERNAQGKLEKVFEGDHGQYQLQQIKAGKDPNPFSNNAEDIWYNHTK